MSLEDKITQMLMVDFRRWQQASEIDETSFTVMNAEISGIIARYKFGGIILFGENFEDTEQTVNLVSSLKNIASVSDFTPMFIGVDQEGGSVTRIKNGTTLPGNMAIGATASKDDAFLAGEILSSELSSLGINLNFAPSLDVNNNPANPVIGLRSFSSDPDLVSELGLSLIEGQQKNDVISAAKHFPGHGNTEVDSHLGLPVVNKTYEELSRIELKPFVAAINEEVDMLMTAHIQFPQIESSTAVSIKDGSSIYLPATLSPEILTTVAREKLNYNGVIITDAMNMSAISENFGESEAVILAMSAGADIILMPTTLRSQNDVNKLESLIQDIISGVETGRLSEDRIDASVRRIVELKQKRGILDENTNNSLEEQTKLALETVGSEENLKNERKIADDAITLYDNQKNLLPLKPSTIGSIAFFTTTESQSNAVEYGIKRLQSEGIVPNDMGYTIVKYDELTQVDNLKDAVATSSHVVVCTNVSSETDFSGKNFVTQTPEALFDFCKEQNKAVVQLSTNQPYDANYFSSRDAVLITYGYRGEDPTENGIENTTGFGPNIPAAIDILFGKFQPHGKLPVDLPLIVEGEYDETSIVSSVGYSSSDWSSN